MKSPFLWLTVLYALITLQVYVQTQKQRVKLCGQRGDAPGAPADTRAFRLSSPAFMTGRMIPKRYAADGENISPPLSIENASAATRSFALIMEDPDSPAPPVFDHWLMWNIPGNVTHLDENEVPQGAMLGRNTLKNVAYDGPCTPNGMHTYYVKLYALDTELDLPEGASKSALMAAMKGHILAQTQLMGIYKANWATKTKLVSAMATSLVKA